MNCRELLGKAYGNLQITLVSVPPPTVGTKSKLYLAVKTIDPSLSSYCSKGIMSSYRVTQILVTDLVVSRQYAKYGREMSVLLAHRKAKSHVKSIQNKNKIVHNK